ncbi:helix-turn-helix domain-containing protein [Micromonospora echinospora]
MPTPDPLIAELRALRRLRGITADTIATTAGITTGGLSKLENGHSGPRLSTVRAYAKAIGYDLHLISADTGDAHLTPLYDLTPDDVQALRHLADRLTADAGWITPALRTALHKLRTKETDRAH